MNRTAVMSAGTAQNRKSSRQLRSTSGSTRGRVSAGPLATPTMSPLVETAVARPTWRWGTQDFTRVGSDGCMIATPKPMMAVAK